MANLVFNHYGLPRALREEYNKVLQGTLDALYGAFLELYAADLLDSDEDTYIVKSQDRLVITDMSAGWWAVLQVNSGGEFWIHSNKGRPPETLDWEKLDMDFMEDRCLYHVRAYRDSRSKSWSCAIHQMDLKHPLLMVLQHLISDLQGEPRE